MADRREADARTLLVRNIHTLVTMDDRRREIADGALLVRGNQVVEVGTTDELPDTADEVLDLHCGIFGPGRVYGVLVMGREPRDSFLIGLRELADMGVNVVPFVWSPNPGSRLEGHRAPTAEWYVDTILEAGDIFAHSGVPGGDENHCYRCDGNSLLHDVLRGASK